MYLSVSFITAFFLTTFYNLTFFKKLLAFYPFGHYPLEIISVYIVLFLIIFILLQLISFKHMFKTILVILFFIATLSAHTMDHFGTPIDKNMIQNLLSSDVKELHDLLSFSFLLRILFMAILPMIIILRLKLSFYGFKHQLLKNLKRISLSLLCILLLGFMHSKFYASCLREHKELRYFTTPTYALFSAGAVAFKSRPLAEAKINKIGTDSKISPEDHERDLVILVLGETARSDRFSLNGYHKKTNPLLEKESVISFTDFYSCGTSTAESLPCLFSNFGMDHYERNMALQTDNILDILKRTGDVNVLWRDNNSDSKGVALRIPFQDFKTPELNLICDPECRDEGMLGGLQAIIDNTKEKDILIVLHQMGSHGPAYFKRYPQSFEKFVPACHSAELSECTQEEINNAYDNTILYTDYFLSKVIALLKVNSKKFETTMMYVSDHGESLGENGIYLHSLPTFIAPVEQIKIPAILWFGASMLEEVDVKKLNTTKDQKFTHDNIFHTLLGLFEIETTIYNANLDLIR